MTLSHPLRGGLGPVRHFLQRIEILLLLLEPKIMLDQLGARGAIALRLAYLAPTVLDKLLIQRMPPAVSVKELAAAAELPWVEEGNTVFGLKI